MRFWHAAGIRPVILRPQARVQCLNSTLTRTSTWSSSRLKSSDAKKTPDVSGDDEDEAINRALQNILSSLKSPQSSSHGQDLSSSADADKGLPLSQFFQSLQSPSAEQQSSLLPPKHLLDGQEEATLSVKSSASQKSRRTLSGRKATRQSTIRARQPKSSSISVAAGSTPASEGQDQATKESTQAEKQEKDAADPASAPKPDTDNLEKAEAESPQQSQLHGSNETSASRQSDAGGHVKEKGPTARRRRTRLRRSQAARAAQASEQQSTAKDKDVSEAAKPPIYRYVTAPPSPFDPPQPQSLKEALKGKNLSMGISQDNPEPLKFRMAASIETLSASDMEMTAVPVDQPPVPRLNHDLDRVLFNKGVYQLQDPDTMVYNFDPYLQKIMPVAEFDFNALAEYKTSSQDEVLSKIAKEHNIKYVGSTSSMTSTLGHFHYLLSNWRPINLDMLSKGFPENATGFTEINKTPNSIFLRWKNGTYAIDADKEYDGANVLMLLGKSLEKLLTMPPSDFERYRKSDPRVISESERTAPDSFHFSTQGDFLMRSQLDAHDPRLPGTGMFDLKTRAVVSVRMQSKDYEEMSDYELHKQHGRFESYEREYYDMCRSTMLKYSLQARMGRMDGIFVAYHNVKRIFGFQYLNLSEMDRALHGQSDRNLGNQEFSLSIDLLNKILNKATERYPDQSLRFHFETRPGTLPFMYVFAEPMNEVDIDKVQNSQKKKIAEYERSVMGIEDSPASVAPASNAPVNDAPASNAPVNDAPASNSPVIPQKEASDVASRKSQEETTEIESGTLTITDIGSRETASTDLSTNVQSSSAKDGIDAEDSSPVVNAPQTSDSPADKTFLSLIDGENKTLEENLRPLIAMTLTTRSRVNGNYVERPEDLSPSDEWKVEYALSEISSPSRAWALYEASKARRRKIYERMNAAVKQDDERTEEERKRERRNQEYMQLLRGLSQKGKELRGKIEMLELEREKVVVGQPHGKVVGSEKGVTTSADTPTGVEIRGVDDYLGWLFKK